VLWFGGTNGITRFEHDRGLTIRDGERLPIRRVKAIAHDQFGFLWIAVDNGILRIHRTELNNAGSNSAFWPAYVLYDKSDGLAGLPRLLSDAMSIHTRGGALWFVTGEGITVVNPNVQKSDGTSAVRIDHALVDDHRMAVVQDAQLPAGTRRIQLEYGAANLTSAQKTRYRFRLEGIDSDWVTAGSRRQATYMNLPPGAYRFHVVATSSLGAWQGDGTTWEFSIKPHFFQTTWFYVLCGSLIVVCASFVWRFRLRMERNRFSVLLAERARVSREIHDTLLQGLVGLTLQCDALAQDVESAAPDISERLLSVRKQAQRYIKESRQAIWNLRFSARDREPLVGALRGLGDVAAASHVKFDVALKGAPRELESDTEQQLVRIAREAVMNAVRHSGAQRICVELEYEPAQLVLRVSDDGHGFVDTVAGSGEHFGIVSMRERSKDIGAAFSLDAGVGRGTLVEVVVNDINGTQESAVV
jgi:signal transduction histidine kinase